jgi:hypothetical protein
MRTLDETELLVLERAIAGLNITHPIVDDSMKEDARERLITRGLLTRFVYEKDGMWWITGTPTSLGKLMAPLFRAVAGGG